MIPIADSTINFNKMMNRIKFLGESSFYILILILIACNPSDSSDPIEKGLLKNQVIKINGTDRNYHIFIPDIPNNAPIVMLFHGNGSNYDDMLGLSGVKAPYKNWLNIAEEQNLIVVVPNGTLGSSGMRGWNDCRTDASTNPDIDDISFVNQLLDFIINQYKANPAKVFVSGTSNGGHFAIRLAQEIPNRITAFAAIVASNAVNSQCPNSSTKVSALFMNGTDDPILPYEGGQMASNRGEVISTENSVMYWVQRNQASTSPEISNLPNINSNDNSTVSKYLYKNGGNNTEVVLYKIEEGGHTEPSITQRYSPLFLLAVGNQNGDIEMATEVWNFFKNKSIED
jgi:polyhydroxybutyrate depolymerase